MIFERSGLLLPENTNKPYDLDTSLIFTALHDGVRPPYQQLAPQEAAKEIIAQQFIGGESPDLTVQHIDVAHLEERVDELRGWKRNLLADTDLNPDIKQAYRWRINEDIANAFILKASAVGNMKSFKRWNEFIYGKPNEKIYKAALDWVASDAEDILLAVDPGSELMKAARETLNQLSDKRGDMSDITPDPEVFEEVRESHIRQGGYYALLLSGIEMPEVGPIKPDIGNPILRQVVTQSLKSTYTIKPIDGTVWSVSHSDNAIEHPEKYSMPLNRFQGLALGHEIGSHLLEKVNGERGPIALAVHGLDRYESGNEGRAVIREQVPYESFDEFGKLVRWRDILRRHIAISYASGVGDDEPRDAAEVFNFMNTIDLMYQLKANKNSSLDEAKEKANKKTVTLLTRVLKGTDGKGGAYLKDIVYLEGNVTCWQTASTKGAEAISTGDLGKFDINNDRHVSLLLKYGLLPDNDEL